jgi:hypothetical protein
MNRDSGLQNTVKVIAVEKNQERSCEEADPTEIEASRAIASTTDSDA